MDDDRSRDVAIWDAGYAAGYQHAIEGRSSVLPCTGRARVIDLRAWRVEHVALTRAQLHAH